MLHALPSPACIVHGLPFPPLTNGVLVFGPVRIRCTRCYCPKGKDKDCQRAGVQTLCAPNSEAAAGLLQVAHHPLCF